MKQSWNNEQDRASYWYLETFWSSFSHAGSLWTYHSIRIILDISLLTFHSWDIIIDILLLMCKSFFFFNFILLLFSCYFWFVTLDFTLDTSLLTNNSCLISLHLSWERTWLYGTVVNNLHGNLGRFYNFKLFCSSLTDWLNVVRPRGAFALKNHANLDLNNFEKWVSCLSHNWQYY